jgi:very-short-patch-repair endonuclease
VNLLADLTEIMTAVQLAEYEKRTKATKRGQKSKAMHDQFAADCRARQMPTPRRELQFALEMLERRWKFDFAWPEYMVAVEVEGLVYRTCYDAPRPGAQRVLTVYGRHASPQGIKDDMEKYNAAALLGWYVLRFERDMIMHRTNKVAVDTTLRVLYARGWRM